MGHRHLPPNPGLQHRLPVSDPFLAVPQIKSGQKIRIDSGGGHLRDRDRQRLVRHRHRHPGTGETQFQFPQVLDVIALQGGGEQAGQFRFVQRADAARDAHAGGAGPVGGVHAGQVGPGQGDDLVAGKKDRLAQRGSRGQTNLWEGHRRGCVDDLIEENAGTVHPRLGGQLPGNRRRGGGIRRRRCDGHGSRGRSVADAGVLERLPARAGQAESAAASARPRMLKMLFKGFIFISGAGCCSPASFRRRIARTWS